MLQTISLSRDIVGYLPSSHMNLYAEAEPTQKVGFRVNRTYLWSDGRPGLDSIAGSRPGEVGVDRNTIDGEGPTLDPSGALEVLNLPLDLV
jgi:hypothetical protein